MLGLAEIQRFVEFAEKLSVRTGAKPPHLFHRLRLEDEQSQRGRKHEPAVEPVVRGGLIPERKALFKKRRGSLNISGLSDAHDFPTCRRRVFHMLENMRRIHEVEGDGSKRKDGCFTHDQFGSGGHDQGIAATLPSVCNVSFQQMRHAGKGIVSGADLQDTTREQGPSPPRYPLHNGSEKFLYPRNPRRSTSR